MIEKSILVSSNPFGGHYLLDTNVLSEGSKPRPAEGYLAFMEQANLGNVFLSVITIGELRRGVLMTTDPVRLARLLGWLEQDVQARFGGRLLPVDQDVMLTWARMVVSTGKSLGQLPSLDSLIAATALHHGLTVVTRNTKDFQQFGVPLLNPFNETL